MKRGIFGELPPEALEMLQAADVILDSPLGRTLIAWHLFHGLVANPHALVQMSDREMAERSYDLAEAFLDETRRRKSAGGRRRS